MNKNITIERDMFRALVREHLLNQQFPGTEEELEDLINEYEQLAEKRANGIFEYYEDER